MSEWLFRLIRLCYIANDMLSGICLIRGLGRTVNVEWCREHVLRSLSLTKGNFMSLGIVVFFTYQGAAIAILRILSTIVISKTL